MIIDDQIKNEILLSILIEKLQKYQSYYQAKLISMKLLQLKKLASKQKLIRVLMLVFLRFFYK